jgi:hypothetical protein
LKTNHLATLACTEEREKSKDFCSFQKNGGWQKISTFDNAFVFALKRGDRRRKKLEKLYQMKTGAKFRPQVSTERYCVIALRKKFLMHCSACAVHVQCMCMCMCSLLIPRAEPTKASKDVCLRCGKEDLLQRSRVARWYFFKPKIPIWVNVESP